MRRPFLSALLFLGAAALLALPDSGGQVPKTSDTSAPPPAAETVAAARRDLGKFTAAQRHFYLSGQRGMDWLQRINKADGRFVYGFLPALRLPMEGDSYVRQAGAALALARASKFYGDDRSAAVAKQALLTLLLETTVDSGEPHVRNAPIHQANPLVPAGTLVAAIHELPSPASDLLDQADQLANLLRKQIQADGSLNVGDTGADNRSGALQAAAVQRWTGPALYGIIRSQPLRPAAWKLEALRKARACYHSYWKQNKNVPMLAWHTAAYAEAYLLTKEAGFAEAVFEMNDWLWGLQYQQVDPGRTSWVGGFQPWVDGKAVPLAPDIGSAAAALSLAEACRVARAAGDVQRHQRYRAALESGLQFLTTLQYSEANTQHFADWYRPALVGAFHASHQDGNLRLDYVQDPLLALVQYLYHLADLP
jgi:hypothetical protein